MKILPFGGTDPDAGLRALRTMARHLERSNSVLCRRTVQMNVVGDQLPSAAWTIGNDIYFNQDRIPHPVDKRTTATVMGINNHELGHVLLTPTERTIQNVWRDSKRGGSVPLLGRIERDQAFAYVWNLLEDQRIESIMVHKFPTWRPYLTLAFVKVLLKTKDDVRVGYLFAHGRRFLPRKIRQVLRKVFKYKSIIPDVQRIIDEYRTLNLKAAPGLVDAERLTSEMLTVLQSVNFPLPDTADHPGCSCTRRVGRDNMAQPDEEARPEQRQADISMDRVEVQNLLNEMAEDEQAAQDANGDAHVAQEGEGEQGDSEQGGGEADSQTMSGSGGPAGLGGSASQNDEDAFKDIERAISAVLEIKTLEEGVKQAQDVIRGADAFSSDTKRQRTWRKTVPDGLPMIARKAANQLQKIEADNDGEWISERPTGRVNMQRASRQDVDYTTVYDEWTEDGIGGSDMEIVCVLDVSGSMHSHLSALSEAAWMVKKMGDIVGAATSVVTFGSLDHYVVVYGPKDKASGTAFPVVDDGGGTEPRRALQEAYQVLTKSKRQHKMLFVFTDGSWSDSTYYNRYERYKPIPGLETSDKIIKALNNQGVDTALLFMNTGWDRSRDSHGCKTRVEIQSMEDFPPFVRDALAKRLKRKG